jgi:hypothetical protein
MNSRGFMTLRMLIEFIIAFASAIAAVDVGRIPISSYLWVDLPCRLILALLALGILADAIRLLRDIRA